MWGSSEVGHPGAVFAKNKPFKFPVVDLKLDFSASGNQQLHTKASWRQFYFQYQNAGGFLQAEKRTS